MVMQIKLITQNLNSFFKRLQRPYRTYIVPSSFGLATGLLVVLILLLAFVYANNLVYAAVFFVASFCIQNMIRCAKNIEKLFVSELAENEIFAGETSTCTFEIENRGNWDVYDATVSSNNFLHPVTIQQLAPQQKEFFQAQVLLSQRGWQQISGWKIQSFYPFQMFRSWKKVRMKKRILIFPEKKGISLFQMQHAQNQRDEAEEFLYHLPYQQGQSFLRIDWKIYARLQKFMVKKYGSDSEINTDFRWDQTESLGDSELRLSQLTLWIHECYQRRIEFSLQLPHRFFPKSAQHQHYQDCLRELAVWK